MSDKLDEEEKAIEDMLAQFKKQEEERIERMEPWLKDLQDVAKKSSFEIFSIHYPWGHAQNPYIPVSHGNTLTMMKDGFPHIRFRVIEKDGQIYFKLHQYRFKIVFNKDRIGKLYTTLEGKLFRRMQKHIFGKDWDELITMPEMKLFIRASGLLSCSYKDIHKLNRYVKEHEGLPSDCIHPFSWNKQKQIFMLRDLPEDYVQFEMLK